MGTWNLLVNVAEGVTTTIVLWLMGWAAFERARLRRQWLARHRELDGKSAPFDFCVATSVVAGCL